MQFSNNHGTEGERTMMGLLMESVVISFALGGVTGAVTALHLLGAKKINARVESGQSQQRN